MSGPVLSVSPDASRDQPHVPLLSQDLDAEPPLLPIDPDGVDKIDRAVFLENPLPLLLHVDHREHEPRHFFVIDRLAPHGPQGAASAHKRRQTNLQVQVAALSFHDGAEQLVDLQFLVLAEKSLLAGIAPRQSSEIAPCAKADY